MFKIFFLYIRNFILIIFFGTLFSSCGIYSFQQGTIPPEIQTISIENVYNESGLGPPNLGQIFTEKLKSYYQQNSRLSVVNSSGDWQLEGRIVGYQTMPIAPQGDRAALNRLTIRVSVKFINVINEKENFDETFSFFDDYEQNQTASVVEGGLIEVISDAIVLDIFTRTTSNW